MVKLGGDGVKILIKFHSLKIIYLLDNVYALGYFAISHCMDAQNRFLSTTAIREDKRDKCVKYRRESY